MNDLLGKLINNYIIILFKKNNSIENDNSNCI